MNFRKFQFNTISSIEAAVAAILILPTIFIWCKAFSNLSYYVNFNSAIANYPVDQNALIDRDVSKSESAKPDDLALTIFKANYGVEKGKIKESRETYKNLLDSGSGMPSIPCTGLAVCKLHEIDRMNENGIIDRELRKLTKEVEDSLKEDRRLSDISIVLGHIYLKRAMFYEQAGEKERSAQDLETAYRKFKEIEEKTTRFAKMDKNGDGTIRDSEWEGRKGEFGEIDSDGDGAINHAELNAAFIPPGKSAMGSLYLGLAITSYLKGQELLKKTSEYAAPSETTHQLTDYFHLATLSFRKCILSRNILPGMARNVAHLYGRMLKFPWLSNEKRTQLIQETKDYEQEIAKLRRHLSILGEKDKVQSWELEAGFGAMKYGTGVAYFYMGDIQKSIHHLKEAINLSDRHNMLRETVGQFMTAHVSSLPMSGKNLPEHFSEPFGYYRKEMESLEKVKGVLSVSDFIKINNWGVLNCILDVKQNTGRPFQSRVILESLLDRLPTPQFYIGVKEDPVTPKQIVLHNLYKVLQISDKPASLRYRRDCLTPEPK